MEQRLVKRQFYVLFSGCPAILPPAENADPAPMVEDPATIDWLVGSIRKYECHKGFTFTAPPQVKCMGNGEWSFPEFQCISCKFPAPIVQNAQILGKYTTTIGSTVLYKCDDKYVESGTITRICQENAEWSHPTHSCGGCIEPMPITHATYSAGGYLVGDTRIYTCDKRYAPSGLDTIVCQKDGLWSKTDFMCSTCSKPPKIDLATTDYKGELFVGTEIVYQCKPGYLAQGKSTALRCLKDGTWSPAEFSCIACGIPQPIPLTYLNIPPNVDHFLIGSRLNYYCHDEFSAVGYTEIVCMPDATWSMPDFKCINCGPPPPVMNATFPMVPALVGTVLSYTCEKEYIADGPTDIMCHEDGQWDIPKFKCITCGFPPIAQNTYPPEGPTTIGSILYYTCRKGYTSKDKIWTECGKDGHWTPASGGCYACQKPPKIDHAYLLDFKDGPEAGKHIGVTRKYKCDTGYAAVGTTEIFCGGDGMWTPIDLKCITCKPPPKLEFAVPQEGPRYIGTVLEYPCLPGYVSNIPVSIECLGDGTWSPSTDVCRPCDPPKEILYGKAQPITPDDIYRRVGSRWTYVCNAGYKFVGKNQEITCNSDATWTDMYGECKIDCGEIPFVPNTILPFGPTTAGTVFEYGCKEGYVSVNPIKIECLANGTWTRPLDKCRDCGDPKSVLNAVYTTNNGNLVGSVAVFTCKKGFKASGSTEIKCGPNGQWSKPVFTCSAILPVKKDPKLWWMPKMKPKKKKFPKFMYKKKKYKGPKYGSPPPMGPPFWTYPLPPPDLFAFNTDDDEGHKFKPKFIGSLFPQSSGYGQQPFPGNVVRSANVYQGQRGTQRRRCATCRTVFRRRGTHVPQRTRNTVLQPVPGNNVYTNYWYLPLPQNGQQMMVRNTNRGNMYYYLKRNEKTDKGPNSVLNSKKKISPVKENATKRKGLNLKQNQLPVKTTG